MIPTERLSLYDNNVHFCFSCQYLMLCQTTVFLSHFVFLSKAGKCSLLFHSHLLDLDFYYIILYLVLAFVLMAFQEFITCRSSLFSSTFLFLYNINKNFSIFYCCIWKCHIYRYRSLSIYLEYISFSWTYKCPVITGTLVWVSSQNVFDFFVTHCLAIIRFTVVFCFLKEVSSAAH